MAEWNHITHRQEHKCYGLIVEWKSEGPLIMEGKPMTYEHAFEKARKLQDTPHVIRIAVFKMQGDVWGNDTLIPKVEG